MRRSACGPGRGALMLFASACVAAALLNTPAAAAPPAPEVDQSFTGPISGGALIDDCCSYWAQTFTAGRDGVLAGVNISTSGPVTPLRVSIRDVEGSFPGSTVLATTVLPSADVPLTQLITFPELVDLRAGAKYAIVINLENPEPQTGAVWFVGFGYPGGEICFSPRVGNTEWVCNPSDGLFRTYLTPRLPTVSDQCESNGWRTYGVFKNQGDCVSFVATKGKNKPSGG